jgi:hypothetical protein
MISARLRFFVVWMGVGSIRCTYSGVRLPLRFTRTTNLVCLIPITIAIVVALIADLDTPSRGLIRLDQRALQRLKAEIAAEAAHASDTTHVT